MKLTDFINVYLQSSSHSMSRIEIAARHNLAKFDQNLCVPS